jgi:serine/threonine-protein kinase HipA
VLPYDDLDIRRMKLAMKVGGEYLLTQIGPRQWLRAETELGLPAASLLNRVHRLARAMLTEIPEVVELMREDGLDHPIIGRLQRGLTHRVQQCLRELDA